MQRMAKFRSLWAGVTRLPHLQTQALLLRFCTSFCKVVHLVRTVPPNLWGGCLTMFDSEFRSFMEVVTGPTSDFTWAFMSFYRRGGLGLRSARVHALGAYLASLTEASVMIGERFPSIPPASVRARIEFLREDWSAAFGALPELVSQKTLSAASDEKLFPLLTACSACPPPVWVASLQSPLSACFWRCLPSHRAGTYVDNACFRLLVQFRYHQPVMYPTECPAPGCAARLDVFGHHALCCKSGGEKSVRQSLSSRLSAAGPSPALVWSLAPRGV
jgi:hypothetical protein